MALRSSRARRQEPRRDQRGAVLWRCHDHPVPVGAVVEGLEVIAPSLDHLVVPLSVVILFCLFAVQSRGTAPGPFRLHGDAERAQGVALARKQGLSFDIMTTSFFLSRRSVRPDAKSDMPM